MPVDTGSVQVPVQGGICPEDGAGPSDGHAPASVTHVSSTARDTRGSEDTSPISGRPTCDAGGHRHSTRLNPGPSPRQEGPVNAGELNHANRNADHPFSSRRPPINPSSSASPNALAMRNASASIATTKSVPVVTNAVVPDDQAPRVGALLSWEWWVSSHFGWVIMASVRRSALFMNLPVPGELELPA